MVSSLKSAHKLGQRNANSSTYQTKLDQIEPTHPGFILTHERLRHTQARSHINLPEIGLDSDLPQKLLKTLLAVCRDAPNHSMILLCLDAYPKSGYNRGISERKECNSIYSAKHKPGGGLLLRLSF